MLNKWDIEKIKLGFEKFYQENNRLPTAPEIDKIEYLPSSRQIQRAFGGLEKIRKVLGYKDINFSKGEFRSNIALNSNKKGRESELKLEKILNEKFHEVFVHTEKIFDTTKNRVDFFIYCPEGNFGIDIFHTKTIKDLQKNINIKLNKYQNFPYQLFFVVDNNNFNQEEIDNSMKNKIRNTPSNLKIITLQKIIGIIENKNTYPPPF